MSTQLSIYNMKKMFKSLKMIDKNLVEINNKMRIYTCKN